MNRVIAMTALILFTLPAFGVERVRIPAACRELAERTGVPMWLTLAQAKRAIAYVNVMNGQDAVVARCQRALRNVRIK